MNDTEPSDTGKPTWEKGMKGLRLKVPGAHPDLDKLLTTILAEAEQADSHHWKEWKATRANVPKLVKALRFALSNSEERVATWVLSTLEGEV